ncbi:MAG TPA: SDR family oxidoreductase [Gammaproteobacteria bacterium]|jgi:uncharacterized protein YbjT (DUF2867 family)|nr:SDR family oxidoreductase [Gammaproteobacteria bacterium]HIK77186.1 SDR family oxidoreductase [Gammaproteobacteria bacterium]
MKFRKFYALTLLLLFSHSIYSHDSECLVSKDTEYNGPCIERLKPRALNVIDRTMLEPQATLFSEDTEGVLVKPDVPLIGVLGASGRTGILVIQELQSRDSNIRAFSRNIEKAKENISGDFEWVYADVTKPETLTVALQGVDILISTIGSTGGDNSELIDYQGSINFVDAAKESGVKHIIYMSSIGAGGAENFSTVIINLVTDKAMKWKSLGEDYIRNSGIDFTIVRPGGLRGELGTLGIRFEQGDEIIGWIPRGDVASVLVASIYNPDALNKTFEVINDESLAIGAWRDEFKNLTTDEYGKIATGNLPINYILVPLVILVLIIYLVRRRRKKRL